MCWFNCANASSICLCRRISFSSRCAGWREWKFGGSVTGRESAEICARRKVSLRSIIVEVWVVIVDCVGVVQSADVQLGIDALMIWETRFGVGDVDATRATRSSTSTQLDYVRETFSTFTSNHDFGLLETTNVPKTLQRSMLRMRLHKRTSRPLQWSCFQQHDGIAIDVGCISCH